MAKRLVFRVRWIKKIEEWELRDAHNCTVDLWIDPMLKRGVVQSSREFCKKLWKEDGQLAQLVVHKKDGKIEFEATYGKDPRRFKG